MNLTAHEQNTSYVCIARWDMPSDAARAMATGVKLATEEPSARVGPSKNEN